MGIKTFNRLLTLDLYTPRMKKLLIHQKIMEHPWPLVVGLMLFSLPIFLVGPELMAKDDLNELLSFSGAMVFGLATFIFAMSMKSHIELHPDGIQYKNSPFARELKSLSLAEIKSFKIEKYRFFKYKGLGYKRDLKGNKYIVFRWGKVLEIETKQGKKLVLGINDPAKVKRFIDQNWVETQS